MIKLSARLFILLFLFCYLCCGASAAERFGADCISVPVAGNSWITRGDDQHHRVITKRGIGNWSSEETIIRTFFRLERTGKVEIALRAKVAAGVSSLKCAFEGEARSVELKNTEFDTVVVGTFDVVKPGYHFLDMQGVTKSSGTLAEVTDILLAGEATEGDVYFVKDDFYFGQRGPSVHLTYQIPDTVQDIVYFYNEVTIPKGEDVIGSFFMANGFSCGYFGMQVNSDQERRILFSVWSPYRTDHPQEIPEDQRVRLLKKGDDVQAQKFGGEGSGGQSFRRYLWKTDVTYRFLLKGVPAGNNKTDFAAYFFAPEIGKWELIASFRRPKTDTYLTRLHSFLENFIPATGQYRRKGLYANQWVCDKEGQWTELVDARFTADATARKKNRLDYSGGVQDETFFFMQNCGFFNERTEIGSVFTRQSMNHKPNIDFANLP